jgi:hypothetical protein
MLCPCCGPLLVLVCLPQLLLYAVGISWTCTGNKPSNIIFIRFVVEDGFINYASIMDTNLISQVKPKKTRQLFGLPCFWVWCASVVWCVRGWCEIRKWEMGAPLR